MAPTIKGGNVEERGRKRKPSATSTTSASPAKKTATAAASKKAPITVDYGKLEEKQATERSADKDSQMFRDTCNKMKDILLKIYEAKTTSGKSGDTNDLKNQFLMHFLTLKKLNRLDKLRTKRIRDVTSEAKSQVDDFHLQLQNLLYEVLHLQKEVTKCLQYRSADEDIDLVPVQEFYADAPQSVSNKEKTESCSHSQRLARLEYENMQRKKQMAAFKKLESEKTALETQIVEKRDNLTNLKPQLANILTASKATQKYLGLPLDEDREQLEMARYLPPPLFLLFSETRSFGKACDSLLTASINGDLEKAKSEFMSNCNDKDGDEVDDVDEDDDEDDDDAKAKKAKKAAETKAMKEEKLNNALAVHPLAVDLKIAVESEDGDVVHLTFSYFTKLDVVAVKVKLDLIQEHKNLTGDRDVFQAKTLFCHMMTSPDEGVDCPNPIAVYILKKDGIEVTRDMLANRGGAMYQWAQNLAGLKFPENAKVVVVDKAVCQTSVEQIVEAIRERFKARLALQKEISLLEKSKLLSVDLPIPESMASTLPSKTSSHIRAWTSVDWEQYAALDVTQHLVDNGAVDCHDFLFRLQINRESGASLIALIAVKPDHPRSPPVFCLNLHWNGEYNIHNSENLRALECEVNTGLVHMIDDDKRRADCYEILALQIKKLMSCFDVTLEAWQMVGDKSKADFQREKLFLHTVRGRRRQLPLKYNPNLQLFSQ